MFSCKKPQSFEYREVKNVQVKHVGFNKTILGMDLVFNNPNNFSVNFKKIDCDIFFNKKFIGKYQLDSTIHINKKADFIVPATISFDVVDLLKRGFSIVMNKEALIKVKGFTRVGKSGIYWNIPIEYETEYKLPF